VKVRTDQGFWLVFAPLLGARAIPGQEPPQPLPAGAQATVENSFTVTPHPSPIPSSLDFKRRQFMVLREWVGLISYGMMGRYFSRQVDEPGFRVEAG